MQTNLVVEFETEETTLQTISTNNYFIWFNLESNPIQSFLEEKRENSKKVSSRETNLKNKLFTL